jgi:NAD(P)-dependent dehydrogenase (short-subunit alcohol dehydrogenase family)
VNGFRVAVISGGAGGIGRAVVLRLNRAGFFPFILDSNEAAGKAVLDQVQKTAAGASLSVSILPVRPRLKMLSTRLIPVVE